MIKVSILPPLNRQKKVRRIPRNFFIFGDTMSGKSYLAERFPVPLFLNTDGNSERTIRLMPTPTSSMQTLLRHPALWMQTSILCLPARRCIPVSMAAPASRCTHSTRTAIAASPAASITCS